MKNQYFYDDGDGYTCTLRFLKSAYTYGDGIAIVAYSREDGCDYEEPFADVTVNLPGFSGEENEACLDTNNFDGVDQFLLSIGAGRLTGDRIHSGFCEYPVFEFDEDWLNSIDTIEAEEFEDEEP